MFSPGELNCPSVANWVNSVQILLQFAVCSVLRKPHKKEQNTLGHWQVCTRIFIHQIIKASIWLIGGDFVQLNKQPKNAPRQSVETQRRHRSACRRSSLPNAESASSQPLSLKRCSPSPSNYRAISSVVWTQRATRCLCGELVPLTPPPGAAGQREEAALTAKPCCCGSSCSASCLLCS